jgi:hypothetical protein
MEQSSHHVRAILPELVNEGGRDMTGKVFISYRREDDPAAAARVRDALAARFGKASLFMDIDSLSAGQRFELELANALTASDVFIAIMGPRWMDLLRSRNQSSLRDFVRDEIALALKRKIAVVPVRVGRENNLAPLPRAKDLPSDIRDLVNFQKYDVVHENFARDIAGLAEAIARVRRPKRAFPWAWASAAASIVLFLSALVYVLHTIPVKVIWATSAQAQPTGSVPQTQPNRNELEMAAVFINETEDQARLEAFIRQFGDSPYAAMARARLEELRRRQTAVLAPSVSKPTIDAPDRSRGPFDGNWQFTRYGSGCSHPQISFSLTVSNNAVLSRSEGPIGRVDGAGRITFSRPAGAPMMIGTRVRYSGRLTENSGRGQFSNANGLCAGSFGATRQ